MINSKSNKKAYSRKKIGWYGFRHTTDLILPNQKLEEAKILVISKGDMTINNIRSIVKKRYQNS